MRLPIYVGYQDGDPDALIGWAEFPIPEMLERADLEDLVIAPALSYDADDHDRRHPRVRSFGLVQRTRLDTRPIQEINQ